jgi:hypothetical protein
MNHESASRERERNQIELPGPLVLPAGAIGNPVEASLSAFFASLLSLPAGLVGK